MTKNMRTQPPQALKRPPSFEKTKEALYCAYAHNVPTPLFNIFDLISYQMMKRLKTYIHTVNKPQMEYNNATLECRSNLMLIGLLENTITKIKEPTLITTKLDFCI